MINGRFLVAGAVLATAAAVAATAFASSSGAPVTQRIRFVEREVSVKLVDNGTHGLSPGDQNLISSDILDLKGRVVGVANFACTVTSAGKRLGGICLATLTLKGGQIVGQFALGSGAQGSPPQQAITGGTGVYEGVHGQFRVGNGTSVRTPFTVELVR